MESHEPANAQSLAQELGGARALLELLRSSVHKETVRASALNTSAQQVCALAHREGSIGETAEALTASLQNQAQSCDELLQGLEGLPQLLSKLTAAIVRCEQHVPTSTSISISTSTSTSTSTSMPTASHTTSTFTSTSRTETAPGALEPPLTPPTPSQRDTAEDPLFATTAAGSAELTSYSGCTSMSQAVPSSSRARMPPRNSPPQQRLSSSLPTSITLPPFDDHTPFKSAPSFEDLAASVACDQHQHTRSTRSTPSSSLSSSLSSSPSNPSVLAVAAAEVPRTHPGMQLHRSWPHPVPRRNATTASYGRAPPAFGSLAPVHVVGSPAKHVHWAPQLTHIQQL